MARIKGGLNAKKKHNRTLKLAKGYRGARSKQYRIAKQSVMRALASSYAGRKQVHLSGVRMLATVGWQLHTLLVGTVTVLPGKVVEGK